MHSRQVQQRPHLVPLFVIVRSGALPKRGRTCFCMVVSRRAQVVARRSCRVGSHCTTHRSDASLLDVGHARSLQPTRPQSRPSTLGIDQSHLGFAVLPSALVAIAHSVPGDDSRAARAVSPANATSLDVGHLPHPVRTDGCRLVPPAWPRRWSGDSERGGRRGTPGAFTAMTPAVEGVDRYAEHRR